jgi:glycosyltransferase involved in cell wall biosynthesis
MKLLFLIHSLASGGAERVTANLANHWARVGHEVVIVTIEHAGLDHYTLAPSVRRVALGLAGDSAGSLAALGGNLQRVRAVRHVLKQERPDVAIAMMTQANVLLAIASRGLDLRTIGSERTHPAQMPVGLMWNTLRRFWYGRLDAMVALAGETRDWLARHTSARNIAVIGNPVPWPFPRQEPLLPVWQGGGSGRRLLLAVGRLSEEKGFRTLIDRFAALARVHPEWDLVILGKGRQRQELEAMVQQHGLGARVLLPGVAGNVGDWYAVSDLFVMSSRFEGFPNTLAEAMSHGIAAVSFDCDTGPRDIIRHEVDGLLVEAENAAALEQALDRLMRDGEQRARFAARAREARERFSPDSTIAKWERLFEHVQGR